MERAFGKPKLFRALISLDAGEFARLSVAFEQASQTRRAEFNHFGEQRQCAPGATGNAGISARGRDDPLTAARAGRALPARGCGSPSPAGWGSRRYPG